MFVDASVIVAVISLEGDWRSFASRLEQARVVFVSPLAIWEAIIALTRKRFCSFDEAEVYVSSFIAETRAEIIPVTAETGSLAVDASRRFGRGRHPADLNFGDCFAYASARERGVPLLFKGEDFARTDVAAA